MLFNEFRDIDIDNPYDNDFLLIYSNVSLIRGNSPKMPTLKPTEHKDFNLILDRTFAGFTSILEKVDGFNIPLLDIPVSDQGSSSSPGEAARDGDLSSPTSARD